MREIANAHKVSVARIALAWLLHRPFVMSVIIGATSVEQLDDNLAAVKVTPEGRFGLEMLLKPWLGRVSTTLRFEASEGPLFETTTV